MKRYVFVAIALAPQLGFSAVTPSVRRPSSMDSVRPPLHLELTARDESSDLSNCDSCNGKAVVKKVGSMDALVLKFARYDTLFESMIDNASHHDGGYSLRYKFFF